ncbi:endonuclease/exonuclease/phosphatase family protein [Staphylococcus arlettae]|uniref:endonuclease/exonuclease/phosphatase family protein n=2 Tax=Staphylococcus arlettae TaxID=29378 RepID=UPI000DCC396C|nr:endonuclease/exonuclease/phosphatase family protein [Staphylococcus arlettae]MCP8713491.1 endonuclease [Staphylococcus arlettae]RBA01644.1 Endonuclease/Exonuclease/phosphatase family protein [Staphylococcus arlettae]RBA02107.1 Endonuclease/Exonuclease/phosphatase family protein [Staphylococcus arlettae]RBA06665.1 Endonuclease/Exonuclease/phosphatase family protein [Staphylococcus arlettae]
MKVAWSFLATIVLGAVITTQAEATTQPTKKQEETHDLSIHDIQGDKHNSPYDGKKVTDVQGIVTYQYKLKGSNYIHIQTPDKAKDDNPNTSEGLIVYMGNQDYDVKTGDLVNVTGIVDEYHIDGYDDKQKTDLPVTQINARDDKGGNVAITKHNQPLPKGYNIQNPPSKVSANDQFHTFDRDQYAIDYWESLEGMRVMTNTVRSVSPQEHGDIFTVLDDQQPETINGGVRLTENNQHGERIAFKMYDNNQARDFDVKTGDKFKGPIIGYVNYGFQNYKINVDLEDMQKAHVPVKMKTQSTDLTQDKGKLNVASYNLENFSNNKQSTTDTKATKIAQGITNSMNNPDIVGVTEVQDNDGPDSGGPKANESYERLIQRIQASGGPKYKYVNIDPDMNEDGGQPNANIRVGFLYNPERVQFDKSIQKGDADSAVSYKNGNLTLNPGRIDPHNPAFDDSRKPLAAQFKFRGEQVIMLANHWNSKGGDTPIFGNQQPPVLNSENQRVEIAKAVGRFVDQVHKDNPDANIVSVGDYNDFQWTKALKTFENFNMTNMIHNVPASERYTYNYHGNSQALDHIFVSDNLANYTQLDPIHVNSDFTDMSGRASDHDPLLAQIDIKSKSKQAK